MLTSNVLIPYDMGHWGEWYQRKAVDAEIERLTRGRDTAREALRISEQRVRELSDSTALVGRLRAALSKARRRITPWLGDDPDVKEIDGLLTGNSAVETSGDVVAELEEDRCLFGIAYWREVDGRKIRINPEELRIRMSDGRYRLVFDMDTLAQQQAVFDFVVSLRRAAYNAQREPFIPIGPDGLPGTPEKADGAS